MSFESEIVHSLLENESQFIEDLRERHSIAPVFEAARDRQRELSEVRIPREGVLDKWNNYSQGLLSELDQQAKKEGVLGLPASLRGEDLEIPTFQAGLTTGVVLLNLDEAENFTPENLEAYYASRDVKGYFAGFTMQFAQVDEDIFVPRLSYQIAIGARDMPNSYINLYATGAVGEAQLSFVADERMDTVAPLVEELFTLTGKRLANLNRLNMILASNDTYDAEKIRRIAFDAGKVLKAADKKAAQQVEDKLIDLISEYIKPGFRVTVTSRDFFIANLEDEKDDVYFDIPDDEEPEQINTRCDGLIFLHKPIVEGGVVKGRQNNRTLYMVTATHNQVAYFPLTRVEEFQNQ